MVTIKLKGYSGYEIFISFGHRSGCYNNINEISFCLYYKGDFLNILKYEYYYDTNSFFLSSFSLSTTPIKQMMETFFYEDITEEIAKENIKIIFYFLKQFLPKNKFTLKDVKDICKRHYGIKL